MLADKMENQTIINISFVLLMIAGFTYVEVTDEFGTPLESTHYCESKQIKMYCDHLSGTGITCYPTTSRSGYKRCTGGWKGIPQPTSSARRYVCDSKGCIEQK